MTREDRGKVPNDFPKMKCVSRIYSQGGKPYKPFYSAAEVWKYFATHEIRVK